MVNAHADFRNSALFHYIWTNSSSGLAHRGLDEVSPAGVVRIVQYALNHNLDGNPVSEPLINDAQRAVMRELLQSDDYGGFFEQDSRPLLYQAFGIPTNNANVAEAQHPRAAGSVEIPPAVSQMSVDQLSQVTIDELPGLMAAEYNKRSAFFQGHDVPTKMREVRALGLLKSYADALWSHDQLNRTEQVGHALLDTFETFPYGRQIGAKDFNGAGWGCAQSLVLSMDANVFETKFEDTRPIEYVNQISMDGALAPSMRHVDIYRKAIGLNPGAEAFEKKSVLGFVLGEESGHTKAGSEEDSFSSELALDERRPFETSGLNWGKLLFPGDEEVAAVPPIDDLEFPIDCINNNNQAVVTIPNNGDHMVVKNAAGEVLTANKRVIRDQEGKVLAWGVSFHDADKKEVPLDEVIGYLMTKEGQVLGNGSANQQMDMSWWGFCDRLTAQRLYKSKYKIPDIDVDTVKVRAGDRIIEIPKEAAQDIIDADIPDLMPPPTYCGFRFDGLAQTITLANNEVLIGRVQGLKLDASYGCERIEADQIAVFATPDRPLPSFLRIGAWTPGGPPPTLLDAGKVASITRRPDVSEVTIAQTTWPYQISAELHTPLDWSKAVIDAGVEVLHATPDAPFIGEFVIELDDGSTRAVPAADVVRIQGETEDDVRISQYMAWISEHGGLYGSDSVKGPVVSNGVRWVNTIDIKATTDDTHPDWAPEDNIIGIEGPLVRKPGDKMLWIQARYTHRATPSQSTNFAGWVQVSRHGRILNEGFCFGAPDFAWASKGELNWMAKSTFNPYIPPEFRVALLVNGVADLLVLKAQAETLNLPENWMSYRTQP